MWAGWCTLARTPTLATIAVDSNNLPQVRSRFRYPCRRPLSVGSQAKQNNFHGPSQNYDIQPH